MVAGFTLKTVAYHDGLKVRAEQLGKLGVTQVDVLFGGFICAPGHRPAGGVYALGGHVVNHRVGRVGAARPHQGPQGRRLIEAIALGPEAGCGRLHDLSKARLSVYSHFSLLERFFSDVYTGRRCLCRASSTISRNSSLSPTVTTACSWASDMATG